MRTSAIDFEQFAYQFDYFGTGALRDRHRLNRQVETSKKEVGAAEIIVDDSRDALLTDFGKAVLLDRYLLEGETFQGMFARVSAAFADDTAHANRLYEYMSKLWFLPATPILSNGGAGRGMPISCFLNSVEDSLSGIVDIWNENVSLASSGGGIGTYWGNVRSIGESVKKSGKTSGIVPFLRVMDSLTLAISQGSLRRGSAAVYLDVHHPEIEEFLEIRKPSGDFNRKCLNIHHGVNLTDEFMNAVLHDEPFALLSPKTKKKVKEVDARELYQKILETRLATGEPYLIHIDTVNKSLPEHEKELGHKVTMSNLCSEILLPTGKDYKGIDRTAVCCLASMNAETWDEWQDNKQIIPDVLRFLDNVLTFFIENSPPEMQKAAYSASQERSVGLGLMGFHSLLQKRNVPFESALAKSVNLQLFKHLRSEADRASRELAEEKGACPDARAVGKEERFSHKLAIAPTASISIICGETSACVEPIPANAYTHKTLSGSFLVRNKYLRKLLAEKGKDNDQVWQSIIENEGSVQHLSFLNDWERDVFKTAFELDQRWIIEFAADRSDQVCQGQSINLFLPADVNKMDLLMLHWSAWEKGVKSLYYCRSKSIRRAEFAGDAKEVAEENKYDECLSCQ